MWRLNENERLIGINGSIDGPATVRVTEYPEQGLLLVQSGAKKVQVDGLDFAGAVTKKN